MSHLPTVDRWSYYELERMKMAVVCAFHCGTDEIPPNWELTSEAYPKTYHTPVLSSEVLSSLGSALLAIAILSILLHSTPDNCGRSVP